MNVTSTTQTQYTTSTSTNKRDEANIFTYEEVAKKKQPIRYETLLDMNYDNMSEVERRELSYYIAILEQTSIYQR